MHEYHVVANIVRQVNDEAKKRNASKVVTVNLILGETLGFDPDAIKLYFQTISEGTLCSGAAVNIDWEIAGHDFYIKNIEIE